MGAVFVKEFKALLRSLVGIISITLFTLASGIVFTLNNVRLAYPSLTAVIATLSLISALTIPAIACLSINSDRKKGTDAYLATLPLSKAQIVLGKFTALSAYFAIPTAVICLYPIILGFFGKISYSYSYIAILFLFVFELFIISLCMMFSALFKRRWLSLTVTYATLVLLFLLGAFAIVFPAPIAVALRFIAPFRRFDVIVYGKLDIPTILFYVLFAVLFVFIAIKYGSPKNSGFKHKRRFSLSCALLALVMLALSVSAVFLPATLRWVDVTPNKIYSVDGNTKNILDQLDEDVTVYLIDADMSEEKLVSFIERYCARSPKIKFEQVDTSKDSAFREKYGFSQNANLSFCLVVESEKRHTVISADELFVWYNSNYPDLGYMSASIMQNYMANIGAMLQQYSPYYSQMSSSDKQQYNQLAAMYESLLYFSSRYINAETELNKAIDYVTTDIIPKLYFVTGNGEKNANASPLDITATDTVPKNAGLLIINTPEIDYSDKQADMLIDYMDNGGRILVFANTENIEMPNLARILAHAGLSVDEKPLKTGEKGAVSAVVNTNSEAFSVLATDQTLKLDMTGAFAINKDEQNKTLEYTTLFSHDTEEQVEVVGNDGATTTQTKVVTKALGVSVKKNGEHLLTLVSGSDTFNLNVSELGDDDLSIYRVSVNCLGALVSTMNKTFKSEISASTPMEYDVSTLLNINEGKVSLVGITVIALIPIAVLGTGLVNIYMRKKRVNETV